MEKEQTKLSDQQAKEIWDNALKSAFASDEVKVKREVYLTEILENKSVRKYFTNEEEVQEVTKGTKKLSDIGVHLVDTCFNNELCVLNKELLNDQINSKQEPLSRVLLHTLISIQRLLYLCGMKEIWYDQDRENDSKYLLTMALGVMYDISDIKKEDRSLPIISSVDMRDKYFEKHNIRLCRQSLYYTEIISVNYVNSIHAQDPDTKIYNRTIMSNVTSEIKRKLESLRVYIDSKNVFN